MKNLVGAVTKIEMHGLLDLIHNSLSCSTQKDFFALIKQFGNLVHFDHLLCGYGNLKEYSEKKETGGSCFNLLSYNYPDEWLKRYLEKNYHAVDNYLNAYLATFELHSWRDVRIRMNNGRKTFVNLEGEQFGVNEGYIYGTRARDMETATTLSFSGKKMAYTRRSAFMMEYAIPHISECLIRIMGRKEKKCFLLTSREGEVLKWLKEGKTGWEISVILGISHRTVSFHVNNLIRKLNAVNSRQAVAIAMENSLI